MILSIFPHGRSYSPLLNDINTNAIDINGITNAVIDGFDGAWGLHVWGISAVGKVPYSS